MQEQRPVMRPSDIRRAVTEWATLGFAVRVKPDGEVTVLPKQPGGQVVDEFDLVDFKR